MKKIYLLFGINNIVLQYCGINTIVRKRWWSKRRKFRTECIENIQAIKDTETCPIYAEPTPSIVCHAAYYG